MLKYFVPHFPYNFRDIAYYRRNPTPQFMIHLVKGIESTDYFAVSKKKKKAKNQVNLHTSYVCRVVRILCSIYSIYTEIPNRTSH